MTDYIGDQQHGIDWLSLIVFGWAPCLITFLSIVGQPVKKLREWWEYRSLERWVKTHRRRDA